MIDDSDAQMLEDILHNTDVSAGLTLVVNSPGGVALAAERIIQVCRRHGGGNYEVVVPRMAKSAATLVCMGATRIHMLTTAELGPIDPQARQDVLGRTVVIPAHVVTQEYKELMERALKTPTQFVAPLLQQLERFDRRMVRALEDATQLAEDMALRALGSGMMSGVSEATIRKRIDPFISPERTRSHGRAVSLEEAKACRLKVRGIDPKSSIGDILWQLFVRTDHLVSTIAAKAIETSETSFTAPIPRGGETQ
jgi:hypothetical protein